METETWVDFVRDIRNCLFFSHFLDQLRQFLILSGYISIILSFMRYLTFCTVFYSVLCKPEIPAAVFSQRIQRTITEETIEVLRIRAFMARKVFTLFVSEIRKMFSFPIWFFHDIITSVNFYTALIIAYFLLFIKWNKYPPA